MAVTGAQAESEPDETSEERTCNRTDAAGLAEAGLVLVLVGGECFSWQFE